MPNLFRMLEKDHQEVAGLLEQLTTPRSPGLDDAGRRALLDLLMAVESRHEAAEEMVFWPAVRRRLDGGKAMAQEGRRQEGDAKYMLDSLRFQGDGPDLDDRIQELAAGIRRHVHFEELEVWPALRQATGPIGGAVLGRAFGAARRAGPTRPHPHGPDGPVGLATAGMASAAGDRLADKVGGRATGDIDLTAGGGGLDAVDFIVSEHRRIEGLLRQVEGEEWPDPDVVDRLVKELSAHDHIERAHLYPALRVRITNGQDAYAHAIAEHGEIAAALAEIDRRPGHDSHRRDEAHRVVGLVRTHVDQEEQGILPALRARLTSVELAQLGRDLAVARSKAPTRPHPHLAGTGLGARMSRLASGPLDRARDALSGRHSG